MLLQPKNFAIKLSQELEKVGFLKEFLSQIVKFDFHTGINSKIRMKQMTQEELLKLTDQELLDEAKKMRSTSITNAVLIGFIVGIIIYSIVKSNFGFFTLILLFFVYKIFNDSKNYDALKKILKERDLK